ncbi:SUMF1/EgtB/PvdO family nonheme iron enzyme [Robiginitalea sp. M366]|uniref:formylglycine-generating enzyme family protein n=1 Tax=Robiginitalea aestuariiviva TaxID=3036903 RepID=UPI00240DD240|nr:SUMF1/EgtB/PvdO family nonheme iron enzyme [Robiginitalea aestuariiviva]MDG1573347.1 SUMF1/EgtB/PvdO family nonheme iron enzyme [Robiginitalea aestuariiviva]
MKPLLISMLLLWAFGFCRAQEAAYTGEVPGTDARFGMAYIEGGTYTPESPEAGTPAREVTLAPFWMGTHEVTWELYRLYLERTGGAGTPSGDAVHLDADAVSGATVPYVDMSLGMGSGPGLPVGNVTRKAAARFCKWLSAKTGHFYRLPTEAEWEYAARAGASTPYFFGSDTTRLEAYGWYAGNSAGVYHQVGQKEPNPHGLYDLYGNVAEWVMDSPEAGTDPTQTFSPPAREYPGILKGGSYRSSPSQTQTGVRLLSDPVWKQRDPQFPRSQWWFTDAPFAGFRVVRPLHPPPPEEYTLYWDLK